MILIQWALCGFLFMGLMSFILIVVEMLYHSVLFPSWNSPWAEQVIAHLFIASGPLCWVLAYFNVVCISSVHDPFEILANTYNPFLKETL